ncbi:MAG: helix-turn-helix domain-containing protein [Clostridiales bacterium]|jgi:DNA-binding PucR family transcriptional regulator|nr:helix-turn-helix domain-containing protein [Eubacteriales bacterium]MDH7566012.1 helix-turn-helix domain-containing protein [Clostridiales bacterium]
MKKSIVFEYESSIVAISKYDDFPLTDTKFLTGLDELLGKLDLKCGISMSFSNFMNLKYYYIQSKLALSEGFEKDSQPLHYYYGDYFLDHLLHSLDNSTSMRSLCHPKILELKEYDNNNDSNSVECLFEYLLNGRNNSMTAKKLHIHRNTLMYRINKILEFIAMDLNDERTMLHVLFSCIIVNYLNDSYILF